VDAGALARQREPLDLESSMAALAATSESRGMSASGVFYEQPAREFNWYRQLTAAPAGAVPADGLATGSTRPEIDTSEPTE
jgi:hypothetical protein